MEEKTQVGFVGLGQMGRPMAMNLLKAGYELRVFDLHEERMAPLVTRGATRVLYPHEVAVPGGIVISMVPDDEALLQIALLSKGIIKYLDKGGILLSTSTISPQLSHRLAEICRQQDCFFLAAPVLGRPDLAERAELSLLLAGPPAAKERVQPLLKVLGKRIFDLGEETMSANAAKLGVNFLIAAAIEAMGEAASLVERYNVDRSYFLSIVRETLFAGVVYDGYGRMIGAQDFSDARFPLPLGQKDVALIMQAADQIRLPLPLAQIISCHIEAAFATGREHEDWSVFTECVTTHNPHFV